MGKNRVGIIIEMRFRLQSPSFEPLCCGLHTSVLTGQCCIWGSSLWQHRAHPGPIILDYATPFSIVSCLPQNFPDICFNKMLSEEISEFHKGCPEYQGRI